jgi:chromosome segregation protein
LQQLQTQLRRIRVDPEGSNVVMQGDVTRIVSMSAKERRGIIDELAGVALFDSRIEQTRGKLDDVRDRVDRCRIVEQELRASRQKLEKDCAKARAYQELRESLHIGRQQEQALAVEEARALQRALLERREQLLARQSTETAAIATANAELHTAALALGELQAEVKALGEDQLLAVQAELAGQEAEGRELARQGEKQSQEAQQLQERRQALTRQRGELRQQLGVLQAPREEDELAQAEAACRDGEAAVEHSRRKLQEVAGRSGDWIEAQRRRGEERRALVERLTPLQAELEQLQERQRQAKERLGELEAERSQAGGLSVETEALLARLTVDLTTLEQQLSRRQARVGDLAEGLALQQRTRARLEQEQAQLEREIARLESRRDTLQESRGTGALRTLLEAGLDGLHGPVAQLGEVDDRHRLALEVAAGSRLSHVVVEDDGIAARAIELLKSRRAGRLTFLPLNRLRASGGGSGAALQRGAAAGLVGRAVDLVRHEPVYGEVFRHVFGDTLVFDTLAHARRELGRCRAVTLEGELLEKSGAMTGGSLQQRSSQLSFGTASEGDEAEPLRRRLLEVGESLVACRRREADLSADLEAQRPELQRDRQRQSALEAERGAAERTLQPHRQRSEDLERRWRALRQAMDTDTERGGAIQEQLLPLRDRLLSLEAAETAADSQGDPGLWKALQTELETADRALQEARLQRDERLAERRDRALAAERISSQLEGLATEEQRLIAAVNALLAERESWKQREREHREHRQALEIRQQELSTRFGEKRRQRDQVESQLAERRQALQQRQWELQRLGDDLLALESERRSGEQRLEQMVQALPVPLPEVPEAVRQGGLAMLRQELDQIQKRMEALEPVNMLALQELEALEQRLADLEERLEVLGREREELLLRIETVATLRQEAFLEAFREVDGHFRTIFAHLSDGEGQLQLENPEQPLEGGLTLVAHPKGKAVRRLASMSGGEKSLTALSFLFALQRFRPSPFYALDEVDSFLDGVNVERLAGLIASQAEGAQFLVVSHRRPMIGAATRTIGVTQARGAHTQVVGLPPAA